MAGRIPPPPTGSNAHEDDAALANFLQRKQEERIKAPFASAIEDRLQVLKPELRKELATILRTPANRPGDINFARSADGYKLIVVNAVVDACRVAIIAGCEITQVASLTTPKSVTAILNQHPLHLSGQRVFMILVQLQRLVTVSTGSGNTLLAEAIAKVAGIPRRDIDFRVFSPGSYRDAALALDRLAGLLAASGGRQQRVRTLTRDAGLLALASFGHLRASEYHSLNVGNVKRRLDAEGRDVVTVSVRITKTKRKGRIPKIRDPQMCRLVLALAVGDESAPLFRSNRGERLSISSLWKRFGIAGVLGVGEPASANILRRSRQLAPGTAAERGVDLGDEAETVDRYYKPNLAISGVRALQDANAAARRRISEARARFSGLPDQKKLGSSRE